jgi:hypothetical protein
MHVEKARLHISKAKRRLKRQPCFLKEQPTRERLLDRFRAAGVSVRLSTAVIKALELKTSLSLLDLVQKKITVRVDRELGDVFAVRFMKDVDHFGLLEAILFLVNYTPMPSWETFEIAMQTYESIAKVFKDSKLEQSTDPRIALFVQGCRMAPHNLGCFRGKQYLPPARIPSPKAPKPDASYKRRLPMAPFTEDLESFYGHDQSCDPKHFLAELIEHIDEMLIQWFPGAEQLFHYIAGILEEHQISVYSEAGQWILEEISCQCEQELFGDFDRYIQCCECGAHHRVTISLDHANTVLKNGCNYCPDCLTRLTLPDGLNSG